MRLPGHVAHVGEMINSCKIFIGKHEGNGPWTVVLEIVQWIILK
jgi:hypothetical protein